jgi:hypothetical protein
LTKFRGGLDSHTHAKKQQGSELEETTSLVISCERIKKKTECRVSKTNDELREAEYKAMQRAGLPLHPFSSRPPPPLPLPHAMHMTLPSALPTLHLSLFCSRIALARSRTDSHIAQNRLPVMCHKTCVRRAMLATTSSHPRLVRIQA